MSTTPIPSPQKPNPNPAVWWILGVLGACVVVLVLAGLIVAAYIARQVRVRGAGNRVEIQTPVGELKVNKAGPHESGLPVYPGSVPSESHGGNVSFSTPGDEHVGISVEDFRSTDSLEKVQAWYRSRLGSAFRQEGPGERPKIERWGRADLGDADLAFVDDTGDGARIVALKSIRDGTKITLLRVGKQEVQ